MNAPAFLSARAQAGLAARGVRWSPDQHADRAALDELLKSAGRPSSAAMWQAELQIGELAGPLVEPGAALNFFAGPRATWLALGPALVLRRRLFAPDLPKELVPLGRSIPLAALPRGWPVMSEQPDRLVRATGVDDYALDAQGDVFARGYSTGGALVKVARSCRALLERLGILFGLSAAPPAPIELRIESGVGERLAARLGAMRAEEASDDLQAWWLGEGVTVCEDRTRVPGATTLWTSSVQALAQAVELLAEQQEHAQVIAPEQERITLGRDAAPPPQEGLRIRSGAGSEGEIALDVVRRGDAITIVQEQRYAGSVLVRETLAEGERTRADYRGAVAALQGVLSPRALDFLARRGAIRDPSRALSRAALTAELARAGVAASPAVLAFEETFGGLAIPANEGETFWFGAGLELAGGKRPRGERVAVGAFPGDTYRMDAAGRIIVDDGVVDAFVLADDARRLFERMAIGQEYPECTFNWPGTLAVELSENIAAALAAALALPAVPELSDTCQAVYARADARLAIWSPPAFAEMNVAPAVAVAAGREEALPLLRALREHFSHVGASVSFGPKVEEVWPEGPPPPEPEGIRVERWDDGEPRGAIAISPEGAITQWIARDDEIRVERLAPGRGPVRERYRQGAGGA